LFSHDRRSPQEIKAEEAMLQALMEEKDTMVITPQGKYINRDIPFPSFNDANSPSLFCNGIF
jgi:hypothetical protein